MSPMDKRLSKLEQLGGDVEDPVTIVYVAMEGSHGGPIERNPIGLKSNALRKGHFRADPLEGSFVEREPGETVE